MTVKTRKTSYIFLTENVLNGEPAIYYAISPERIEILNISDTYDRYGRKITAAEADDFVKLLNEKAAKIANDAYNDFHYYDNDSDEYLEKWSVGDTIYAYDFSSEGYDAVVEAENLKEGEDYTLHASSCEGFNYFDGKNHKTVTISTEIGELSHSIVEDEVLVERLNKAIKKMEFVNSGSGYKNYKYEDKQGTVQIKESYFLGTWADYEITLD